MVGVVKNRDQHDKLSNLRVRCLWNFSDYVKDEKLEDSIAECGVYWGISAHFINKYFLDRTFYLFDIFGGFDQRDLTVERSLNNQTFLDSRFNDDDLRFKMGNEKNAFPGEVRFEKWLFPGNSIWGQRNVLLCQSGHGFI